MQGKRFNGIEREYWMIKHGEEDSVEYREDC